jgi:hypothetical protein
VVARNIDDRKEETEDLVKGQSVSQYLYPIRLQPQIVYPDVLPLIRGSSSASETAFSAIPGIVEMVVQRMGDGALPADNPFTEVLGSNIYASAACNSPDLDRDVYLFKQEYDAVLVAEKQLAFEIPQLVNILATEIQWVVKEGLPFLSEQGIASAVQEINTDSEIIAQTVPDTDASISGLGVAQELMAPVTAWSEQQKSEFSATDPRRIVSSVGQRQAHPLLGDSKIVQTMMMVSEAINLAVNIVSHITTFLAGAAWAAFESGPAGALAAVAASMMIGVLAVQFMGPVGAIGAIAVAVLSFGLNYWMSMKKWHDYIKKLRKERDKIRKTMEQIVYEVRSRVAEERESVAAAMTRFRLVMAEMVERTKRGELLIGVLSCDCKGRMILNFSVDERFTRPSSGNSVGSTSGVRAVAIGALVGAAALMLGGKG